MNTLVPNKRLNLIAVQTITDEGNHYTWAVIKIHDRITLYRVGTFEMLAVGYNRVLIQKYARNLSPETTEKVFITRDQIINLKQEN